MAYAWNNLPNGVMRVTVNTVKFDYNPMADELVAQKTGRRLYAFGNVTSLSLGEGIVTAISSDLDGNAESLALAVDPSIVVLTSLPVWYDVEQS